MQWLSAASGCPFYSRKTVCAAASNSFTVPIDGFSAQKVGGISIVFCWGRHPGCESFPERRPSSEKKTYKIPNWFIILWRLAVMLFLMRAQSGLCSSFVGQSKQTHNTLWLAILFYKVSVQALFINARQAKTQFLEGVRLVSREAFCVLSAQASCRLCNGEPPSAQRCSCCWGF